MSPSGTVDLEGSVNPEYSWAPGDLQLGGNTRVPNAAVLVEGEASNRNQFTINSKL